MKPLPLLRITVATIVALGAALPCYAQEENQDDRNAPREPGLAVRMYQIDKQLNKIRPLVAGQTPNISKVLPALDLDSERKDFDPLGDFFLLNATGFLDVPADGRYEFSLTSDDGSILWIDGQKVVDNDKEHSRETVQGAATLKKGVVPIEVRFFNGVGDAVLILKWKPPGAASYTVVPSSALSCHKGEVRVTSPGVKRVVTPLDRGKPGDGRPLAGVHPSYTLVSARPSWFKPRVGGIDFLSDGRMVLCLWDAEGSVWLLNGAGDGDPEKIEAKKIAAGLAEPLGLQVVNDRIFVLQKQELTELIDRNDDDVVDEYRCVCSGWNVTANFHEFAFGLAYKDGCFWGTLAIAIDPGGRSTRPQISERGSVVKIHMDGRYEIFANGLRTPNGIGPGVDGELFVADNQGDWVPVSKIVHVKEGAFYGSQAVLGDAAKNIPVMPPVVWLPQGEIGNSPSEIVSMHDGPYQGQLLHGEVTHGGLNRVFIEKIDGEYQGCVFAFTQGLEAGVNRVRWGPDGALYIGGIGSTGNWGQEGKLKYGLERIKYNGKSTFEMLAVRAMSNGLEIEFTQPLPPDVGNEPDVYYIEQYWYQPTEEYGGPKLDQTPLRVKSVSLSSDRQKAFLELDGMKPGHVEYIRLVGDWHGKDNQPIWTTEGWYTLNTIPSGHRGTVNPTKPLLALNTLTDVEKIDGWTLLFDGKSTAGWRGFKAAAIPSGWEVREGCLVRTGQGGDIVTEQEFADFELSLQWKVARGGNSGIFYRVGEQGDAVWSTGPEYQVLDNERHADGEVPETSAGSCYALYAPPWDASYPGGVFNTTRILVKGNHVEHWLNGEKQCEYELGSPEWKARVAASKFKDMPLYGTLTRGRIALQDHGDEVWYRNIKIRVLK